jgi:addiction module HigA family antidote
MQMKNPRHPGELIGDNLQELGWNISEAAKGLRMSRQQLHNVIAGRCAITPELAVKLEKAIGGAAGAWLRMQNAYDLARIAERGDKGAVPRFAPKNARQLS